MTRGWALVPLDRCVQLQLVASEGLAAVSMHSGLCTAPAHGTGARTETGGFVCWEGDDGGSVFDAQVASMTYDEVARVVM